VRQSIEYVKNNFQLHQHWRHGCDIFTDHSLGLSGSLFGRPSAEELQLSSIGLQAIDVTPLTVIEAAMWSWQQYIAQHLFAWAWVRTGIVSHEEMAKMQNTSESELTHCINAALEKPRHGRLSEAPVLSVPSCAESLGRVRVGDVRHLWQIKSAGEFVAMPHVVRRVYERSLATLNAQMQSLRQRLAATLDVAEQAALTSQMSALEAGAGSWAVVSKRTSEELPPCWVSANTVMVDGVKRLKTSSKGKKRTGYIRFLANPAEKWVQFDEGDKLEVRVLRIKYTANGCAIQPEVCDARCFAQFARRYSDEAVDSSSEDRYCTVL